jgi:hypothetical protein
MDNIITLNARLDFLAEEDQGARRSSWAQLHIVPIAQRMLTGAGIAVRLSGSRLHVGSDPLVYICSNQLPRSRMRQRLASVSGELIPPHLKQMR